MKNVGQRKIVKLSLNVRTYHECNKIEIENDKLPQYRNRRMDYKQNTRDL